MSNNIKFKLNFTLAKIKRADSKFRITHIHSTNDKHDELAFGNNFNILTKIDPNLALTFTIVDEINDKLIMSYNENVIHNISGFGVKYTEHLTKYHAFNKNEFLKQINYLKNQNPSQQS